MPPQKETPREATSAGLRGLVRAAKLNTPLNAPTRHEFQARSARRQRPVAHLHAAGARPCLEALIEVGQGRDLDVVLEDFARIPTDVYRALGADLLSIDQLDVVEGGRL
jgi:hypothetical protein